MKTLGAIVIGIVLSGGLAHAGFIYKSADVRHGESGYYISASSGWVNGSATEAEQDAKKNLCLGKGVAIDVLVHSNCNWEEMSWNRYRICRAIAVATCIENIEDDVDQDLFNKLAPEHGIDGALKIAKLVKAGQLSADLYLQVRQHDYTPDALEVVNLIQNNQISADFYLQVRAKEDFAVAKKLAFRAKQDPAFGECFLTVRSGLRSGEDSFDEALQACSAIATGRMAKSCYLYHRKGPQFGTKTHQETLQLCLRR